MSKTALFAVRKNEHCPKCGSVLVIRSGKHGPFTGCSRFPECDFIRPLCHQAVGYVVKVLEGVSCPKCHADKALRQGQYGMFVGCTNYPQCNYSENIDPSDDTDIPCPVCRSGQLVRRRSRYGKTFYSCSRYPACQFALNQTPVAGSCPKCQFPLLFEKITAQGKQCFCSNKKCGARVHRSSGE